MTTTTKKILSLIVVISLLVLGYYFFQNSKLESTSKSKANTASSGTQKQMYHCPMHPAVTSDHPGKCPICHMDLVLDENDEPTAHADHSDSAAFVNHEAHSEPAVTGRGGFNLTTEKQQLIGVA